MPSFLTYTSSAFARICRAGVAAIRRPARRQLTILAGHGPGLSPAESVSERIARPETLHAARRLSVRSRPSARLRRAAALRIGLCVLVAWCLTTEGLQIRAAQAAQDHAAPLNPIPADRARALAPLLRSSDIALVESQPNGSLKQLTILTLVAARPETVREVVLRAERYPDFLRNLSRSQVTRNDDGSFDHAFHVAYGFVGFSSRNRFADLPVQPDVAGAPPTVSSDARPVELFDPNPTPYGNRHLRFDFYAAGGGTVMAVYAYTNLPGSLDFVRRFLAVTPLFEHGIALATALTFALSLKSRAEQITGATGVVLPAAGPADYEFLLERGPLAFLRSRGGRLAETSLITRSSASREVALDAARGMGHWSEAIPIVGRSSELAGPDEQPLVDLQLSAPLFSFQSRYAIRTLGYSVDMLAIAGELLGSRLRWDIQSAPALGDGAAPTGSRLILRGQHQFERSSLILRQLYRIEPLMEYGVNLSLYLILLQGVRGLAERSPVAGKS